MSNFSEIIHIESLRKQLLNQIEALDNQIANLNQSVKAKGLEVNLSQIENAADIFKYQNELKASEIEVSLLQNWLELLNSGVDPKSIDLEQLRLDTIDSAKAAQDSFEDQFLDLKEMSNVNEGMMAVSNRLGKQFFSPNLHPDIFKDKASIEAQLRLNTTMLEPELASSVFIDIFPKTLKKLLKSTELDEGQNVVVNNLLQKYNSFIEKGNLSDVELEEILNTIKSDEDLKLIFKQSPDLKPLLNTTLKEIILDIELPEGKPVTELKEIIIRKKSEIAFLQKQLETVDEMATKQGQEKILDINEKYFKQIQELKAQIEQLNLDIRDKIQSMNLQDQQAAKEALETTKSSLESAFVNSSESLEPDTGAIVIKQARTEIINNNFEVEQNKYKQKLLKLPEKLFEVVENGKTFGLTIENQLSFSYVLKNNTGQSFTLRNDWLNIFNESQLESDTLGTNKNNKIYIDIESKGIMIRESDWQTSTNLNKKSSEYFRGNQSFKNSYDHFRKFLLENFNIDIDNLESKSELVESSPTNLIENQETLAREKYKQIQGVFNKLNEKAKAGDLGLEQINQSESEMFIAKINKTFIIKNLKIKIPLQDSIKSVFKQTSINTGEELFSMNPICDFNDMRISRKLIRENGIYSIIFDSKNDLKISIDKALGKKINVSEEYSPPTLEQLNQFYNELTNILKENNIEL
jgi:hypothetical protein